MVGRCDWRFAVRGIVHWRKIECRQCPRWAEVAGAGCCAMGVVGYGDREEIGEMGDGDGAVSPGPESG